MGCLSVKTLCKAIAILFFVNLQGLNARSNDTALPVTTSSSSTQTSPQTPVTTPPASTSSSATESQTSAHSTFPVTTSSSSTQTSPQTPVTKPDVIRNLTVSNVSTSSVFLTWHEPIGKRSFFKVSWTDDETNGNAMETSNTSHHITNLTAGVNYTFCVTAVTADNLGESEPFCISKYTVPNMIRNLTVTNITTSSVILTWQEPVGNRSFFKLQWTGGETIGNVSEITNTSYNITDLTAGVNYTFCITAVAADHSTEGDTFCTSKYTKPDVIMNLTADDITTSSILLKWTKPNGQSSRYRVEYEDKNVTTENISIKINDLISGAQYTFKVFAVSADHVTDGRSSQISLSTKPNMIRSLKASEVTTSSVFLTWDEPSGNRSFFKLKWTEEKRTDTTTTDTFYHITDLTAGVNYTFCITAVAADHSTEGNIFCISQYTNDAVPPIGAIVGSVVAVICFIFIITLIFFLYSKRQTQKQCPDIPVHNIREKINLALRIEDYEEYFKRKHADSNCGFAEEYEELKSVGKAQSKDAAEAIENKAKNRYTNVLPYDASRVKLSMCGNPFDDYINANYVPGYNSRKEFIAAQGPLPVTVNEFWRMMWEKNVYTIVMLTKCNELGRVKCEKYWPSGTNHYHNISVTTTSEITLDSWTIRDFKIKNVKTAETRYVRQFHFTAWPDHGVPQTTEVLIDFRHLVREHMDQYSRHSPTVVHCSAGVGRTGTFIAIDHLIFQIERESMVDVYGIVNDMRMHRPLMVQTEEQYVYLHQCAYDIIRSRTGTNVDLIYQNTEALHSIYQNVKYIKS